MAKYVFINIPSHSHVNSTLPIVQELVQRGEDVVYYLTDEFRATVEATGATFRRYESKIEQINRAAAAAGKPVGLPMYMAEEALYVIPQILESIREEQPDCIIYEILCLSGRIVAELLGVVAVTFRIILAFDQRLTQVFLTNTSKDPRGQVAFQESMDQLSKTYNIQPFNLLSIFVHEEPLNLVTVPRAMQVSGDTFGEQFCFVGSAIGARKEQASFPLEKLEGQPVLYISHGTVYNDRADFFNLCLQAFANTSWKVVMSIGNRVDPQQLGDIPENFLVYPYVPQLEILKYAKLCITHGGMATIIESFSQGVPLIVIPQATSDVMVNARRVEELGLGIMFHEKTLTSEQLRAGAEQV
ncbi:MAG TPA: macrolide family glycosyltransferase, partial [Ktedonobacteraceae bacterium]|nr:macrolide family glycosyltransferase [Ktedonobacteraceae bacterium]